MDASAAEYRESTYGALDALECGDPAAPLVVVMLHGRNMRAADLAPFGASLGVSAHFVFPDAPLASESGRTWWPVAPESRPDGRSARDLAAVDPAGRADARANLHSLCEGVAHDRRLALAGFSQGGMLAADYVLHGGRVDGLALLSSSRIAFDEWRPLLPRLSGLPVLVAHGRDDDDLSISAGEALRDAALAGGADVTWLPFDGGHKLPLPVWRGLRRFLGRLAKPLPAGGVPH